jgi:hypothetical protein
MKKINIFNFAFGLALSLAPAVLYAQQDMGSWETNYYQNYVGQRLCVIEPASLARDLEFTISNDGSGGTNEWGGAVKNSQLNVEVAKGNPYIGCSNPGSGVSGKIALILRGDCEFSQKAKNAQDAGATAIVIVNHTSGGPVGMGPGGSAASVNIPVFMISKEDGDAIAAAIDGGQTVKMSISQWGNGFNHDLGIVKSGVSMWHNYSTPGNQFENGGAGDAAYKGINGAVIANYGSSDETNVTLRTILTFTPNGGSPTEIRRDSVTRPTFQVGDSIISPFKNEYYSLMSSKTPGRYDLTYEVFADNADEYVADNKMTYSFYVDHRIFSKGRYDFANFRPFSTGSYAYSNGAAFMWGPIYHVAKGGYKIEKVQFAVSQNQVTDISGLGSLNVIIWKWKDGTGGQPADGLIQSGEATPIGVATKKFVAGDTSGQMFTVEVTDAFDQNKGIVSEDNTDYWVTAVMPSNTFLACDGKLNYQVRAFNRYRTDQYTELYAPMFQGVNDAFSASPNNLAQPFPFEASTQADSARFAQQRKGTVPAIPMIMGLFPVSVKDLTIGNSLFDMTVYPNPAKEEMKLNVKLDKVAESFHYTILSVDGKVVISDKYRNVQNKEFNISVKDLAAGQYFIIATADDKAITRPFTVVK